MNESKTVLLPEGGLISRSENRRLTSSKKMLEECVVTGKIVEAICIVCDANHNLIVDFGFMKGVIPRNEGAIGIKEGITRDIALISRVNKPICFKVIGFVGESGVGENASNFKDISENPQYHGMALLSRRAAQDECVDSYINTLECGDVIRVKVTHLEQFGCFVDIGRGISSLIPIDAISVSRISHPSDRFRIGQEISAVVKSIEGDKTDILPKITLTHKELLGTWEENAQRFSAGETVSGIVRSVEEYGIFVELSPNLAGLAELRENISVNQSVSVYIKAIIPEKMKIKLIIVDSFENSKISYDYDYYIKEDRVDEWMYSPKGSPKIIRTDFKEDN